MQVLNKVLELRQSQINELTETARITESVEEQEDKRQFDLAAVPLVIQCKPGPMLSRFSSIEDVRRMGGKDAVLTWRACVERMESLLAQVGTESTLRDYGTLFSGCVAEVTRKPCVSDVHKYS